MLCRRSNELNARIRAGGGKFGLLRQETVAWVNGIAAAGLSCCNHALDVEVSPRTKPFQLNCLVCYLCVQAGGVVLGIHGNRVQPQILRCPCDTYGNFSPIRDQHTAKRHIPSCIGPIQTARDLQPA